MITVVVAAATAVARAGLAAAVKSARDVRLLPLVASAPLAQQIEELRPEVIVLALPPADVDALVRTLARAPDPPAVVLLADDPQAAWTAQARRAGVRAVLSREAGAAEIAAAIHAVAAGLVALHPDVVEPARVSAGAPAPASAATGQPLTPREVEILGMMAEGLGNKIIAARLGISDHTVKFHLASIFAKLGAGSRTEAVTLGIRRGFIVI